MSREQLVTDIVTFLERSIETNEVSPFQEEQLNMAIGKLRNVYRISIRENDQDLREIYTAGGGKAENLVIDIVGFLERCGDNDVTGTSDRESLEIAIGKLRNVYKVPIDTRAGDLLAIFQKGVKS